MTPEARRLLRAERHCAHLWLDGTPMADLPRIFEASEEWVVLTLRRMGRTLIVYPRKP